MSDDIDSIISAAVQTFKADHSGNPRLNNLIKEGTIDVSALATDPLATIESALRNGCIVTACAGHKIFYGSERKEVPMQIGEVWYDIPTRDYARLEEQYPMGTNQISHGYCPGCYKILMDDAKNG